MLPRSVRAAATAALSVILLGVVAGRAAGQEAELRLGAGAGDPVRTALLDVRGGGLNLDVALSAGADPGAAVAVRRRSAAGVLGTLVLEGEGAVRLAAPAAGRATLRARGALGPVALRLQGEAWGAPPERFAPADDPGTAPFDRGAALRLEGDGRASRLWLIGGDVGVTRAASGGLAWDVGLDARARRLLGREWDLTLAAEGRWREDETGAALGAGVVWAPRRAPEIRVRAWLDAVDRDGRQTFRPGVESRGAARAGGGRVDWTVRARPGGPDRAPWWTALAWRRPAGSAEVEVRAVARTGAAVGTDWSVEAAAFVPVPNAAGGADR
jgi:hypothetical protein